MSKEYIKRDELTSELDCMIKEYLADNSIQCNLAAGVTIDIRDNIVNKLPAQDVAPVKHGEWKNHNTYVECLLCGAMPYSRSTYCPKCGARMDGGNE